MTKKGFFGRSNKRNDEILIDKISKVLDNEGYTYDHMTEAIMGYISRYKQIKSLTDKARHHIKVHIELHEREMV